MGQDKVLGLFFEEPNRLFKVREIARLVKIPKSTVSRKIKELLKDKLVVKEKKDMGYMANEAEPYFRLLKRIDFLKRIHQSGLIEYLEEHFHPKCIILFGSFSKGEYNKGSDVDLFIQSSEKSYDLAKFERKLRHAINLLFDERLSRLSNELFNNIINGTKLSGYIKIK